MIDDDVILIGRPDGFGSVRFISARLVPATAQHNNNNNEFQVYYFAVDTFPPADRR